VLLEALQEALTQLRFIVRDPLEQAGNMTVGVVQVSDQLTTMTRQLAERSRSRRAVEAIPQVLAHQDGGGIQPTAGWIDPAPQHLRRAGVEEQIVWPLIHYGHNEGGSCGTPGPTDALEKVRRVRGHRTEHGAGEVADIDPHFQGAGTGEYVGIIGMDGLVSSPCGICRALRAQTIGQGACPCRVGDRICSRRS
jgi:hypothetical protein